MTPDGAPQDESGSAVVQRRFYDPRQLPRTWAATRLAQFMHGEGALGTAGGAAKPDPKRAKDDVTRSPAERAAYSAMSRRSDG